MSRKNFTVATAEDGKTTLVKIEKTNVPTGKVVTLEDKKKRREEREKQYRNFRISALKRRAKRMGIPDDKVPELIEKLNKQMDEPKTYLILVMYSRNDDKMISETLANNKINCLFKSDSHAYFEGDAKLLALLRELMPGSAKIHPYAKKADPVLEYAPPEKTVHKRVPKMERKKAATAAKKARKNSKIQAHFDRKEHAKQSKELRNKKKRAEMKTQKLFEKRAKKASFKKTLTVAHKAVKNTTESLKKASTNVKKAA